MLFKLSPKCFIVVGDASQFTPQYTVHGDMGSWPTLSVAYTIKSHYPTVGFGHIHTRLELYTCNQITQDAFLCQVWTILYDILHNINRKLSEDSEFWEWQYLTLLRIVWWGSTSFPNRLLPPVSCQASTALRHTTDLHPHSLRRYIQHDIML